MQSAVIFGLIYAAIAARTGVLVRCIVSGLLRLYPIFAALVIVSIVRGGAAATLTLQSYQQFYNRTVWPSAIVEAASVIEAFWILARHFRRIKGFGWALMGAIAAVSALAALAVGVFRANTGPLSPVFLFGVYTHVGALFAVLLSFVFFRQFRGVPIRPNALRHTLLLSLLFAFYFAAHFIGQVFPRWTIAPNLLLNSGAAIASVWWGLGMTREGEKLPFDPPAEMSGHDFDAEESRHRKSRDELKRASDEAVRKLRA